jgi:periplasmic divalent cation tolerance protein
LARWPTRGSSPAPSLQARLAACVQVEEGLTSFYRWQGRECEDAEVRLTIKTLPACAQALQALFREQHPYELPQFTTVTHAGERGLPRLGARRDRAARGSARGAGL